jgi:hypothetical protein
VKKLIHLCNAMAQLLDFRLVPSFRLRKVGVEFLDLRSVPSFCLRKMSAEFLHFGPVAGFRLRKELALEMLDPRNPFWNGSIQAAHCPGKKIGFSPVRGLRSVR